MSSTNRGAERAGLDFYETPAHCVDVLGLMIGPEVYGDAVLDAGCGTGAIVLGLAEHVGGHVLGIELDEGRAAEAEARGLVVARGDFLQVDSLDGLADHVVMNPPYTHAAEFVRKALGLVERGGLVAALLRIGFLGSASKRLDLVGPASCLRYVGVLSKRPSFCTSCTCKACGGSWQFAAGSPLGECLHPATWADLEGTAASCVLVGTRPNAKGSKYRATRTDSADYAWFVWQKDHEHSTYHGADLRVFPG